MSINYKKIREEMRRRIVKATGIDAVKQLQAENREIDPQGKTLWIAEHCIGGAEKSITPKRSRIQSFLIQYDIFTPTGSGSSTADTAIAAIAAEFSLSDAAKSQVSVTGCDILVASIKHEIDNGKEWRRDIVLFTLDVCGS